LFSLTQRKRFSLFLILFSVGIAVSGCGLPIEEEEPTDGEVLRALNASKNENRTIRFSVNPIPVYIKNIPDGKDEVMLWTQATDGVIQFTFVDDDPQNGIAVRYGIEGPLVCGVTYEPSWKDGVITKASIEIDPKAVIPLPTSGCKQTVAHEVGHALGLFGHTNDGGMMDPDAGNGKLSPQTKRVMKLLYSLPPNTDVSHLE